MTPATYVGETGSVTLALSLISAGLHATDPFIDQYSKNLAHLGQHKFWLLQATQLSINSLPIMKTGS